MQSCSISSRVRIIENDDIQASKISASLKSPVLSSIFGGDDALLRDFLLNDFQRNPVVIRGAHDRVTDLIDEHMFGLDVLDMLENTSSDEIQVWLPSKSKHTKSVDSIKVPTATQGIVLII